MRWVKSLFILIIIFGAGMVPRLVFAEAPTNTDLKVMVDSVWTLVAGMMVFFMNAGFGMLEAGLTQSKNTANILAKNFAVFAMASISFWVIGWGIMFSDGTGFFGTEGLVGLSGLDNSPATGDDYKGVYTSINWTGIPLYVKFFFQLVFAATAATIVSGVVAERIKFVSFLVFSLLLVAFIYPVTGHWIWGGGWLAGKGFWDFAGSTVVHSVGGWAALVGCIMLGSRKGKYKAGKVSPIPGHSMSLATLGAMILWLGWFGFNPGSTMAADGAAIGRIAVVTNAAAAAGIVTSLITAWWVLGKPELSMILNGCLAGLVAITAPCAFVSVWSGLAIGAIAGILVVFSVVMFDKIRLDDPVGALSVHLVNGIWGTLALAIFADEQFSSDVGNGIIVGGPAGLKLLGAQALGVVTVGAFTVAASFIFWGIIKLILGLRVSADEEREGLDYGEHGNIAYPDFVGTGPYGHAG